MSSSTKKYDVFINFRGEDTRKNFTSHLYSALCRNDIKTYIDDNLNKNDEIWPALCQAIQDSHIAIVVFSENYASSKWCLEELVQILECRENNSHKQVVIPVFHEVDPSQVRHQIGSYKEAFAKHELILGDKDNEYMKNIKVFGWKKALTEAANFSGWHSRDYENHSQVIEKIVDDVLQKLYLRFPIKLKVERFVGIDKMCECVESLLSKNNQNRFKTNVKVIGIWGMRGIGKTTIATIVFSRLFPQYDSVSFLENVREESKRLGQTSLRDKLLYDLLKEEKFKSSPIGSTLITRRLNSKKVFIVLDDVDTLDQLDMLYRECKYAAAGSKLIVTTTNKQLLVGIADEIYDAELWSFEKSLELFCLYAFKQTYPQEGYEDLSTTAVDYARGVPLALKVLGSNLWSKGTEFWDCELKKIKNHPYEGIEKVLRVSYEGLGPLEKEIFLDIAFFFKDENKDFVKRILNACGFSATSGIEVLEDKALITISKSKRVQMHGLLQEMGLSIVRQDIKDPGKRSRLRDIKEVYDVLQNKKGSDAVEGISLDLSHIDDVLSLSNDAFDMMTQLRFLKLYVPLDKEAGIVDYPGVLNRISDNLRYLEWHGYRLKSLPATFSAKMLVEIHLPRSDIKELWQGVKDVVNLEGIDLSECKQLKNIPNLSKASKLKWVNLTSCESLLVIHPSVLSLDTLETLILDNCKKLEKLKSETHLRSLKKISVTGCTSLEEFSMSSVLIESLDLSKTGIQELNPSIGILASLKSLILDGLRLGDLPRELSSLKHLGDLRISNCSLVLDKLKLHVLFEGLRSLRILYLTNCCEMCELPDNISRLSQLYELRLDGSSVESLPESIKHLHDLEILFLKNCMKLCWLPKLPPNVKEFDVINCVLLVKVSTLKTFAEVMRGKKKYISFQNCIKLDEPSLHSIMEGAQLSMMSAIFHNVFVRRYTVDSHSYNYNFVKFCWPGSSVPAQFTYRETDSPIPIKPPSRSHMLGTVLCAVLSPSPAIKKHGAKIFCQCYLDGRKVGYATKFHDKSIWDLNSDHDHVFLWYDAFHFDSTLNSAIEEHLSFEFYVTDDSEKRDVLSICIKECGVHLVFDSDLNSFIRELELDLGSKQKLASDLAAELGIELRPDQSATLIQLHPLRIKETDPASKTLAIPPIAHKSSDKEVVIADDEAGEDEAAPQPQKKKSFKGKIAALFKPPKPQAKVKQTNKATGKRKQASSPSRTSSKKAKQSKYAPSGRVTKPIVSPSKLAGLESDSSNASRAPPSTTLSSPASVSKVSRDPDSISSGSVEEFRVLISKPSVSTPNAEKDKEKNEAQSADASVQPSTCGEENPKETVDAMVVDTSAANPADDPLVPFPSFQVTPALPVQEALETPVEQPTATTIEIPEAILGEASTNHPAPPTSTEIPPTNIEQEKAAEPELEDLIDLLSEAGRRSSSRSAQPKNVQGQDSSDSQAVKLMQDLRLLFQHPIQDLISGSDLHSSMANLLQQLGPIKHNLPASSRGIFSSVQDFFDDLTNKLSTINGVMPPFEAEEINKDKLLGTLRTMKATKEQETHSIADNIKAEAAVDKEIADLEAALTSAKERKLQIANSLLASRTKIKQIDDESKKLGNTARAIVAKLTDMEPQYMAAKADKEALEKTWEEIRNSQL